MKLFDLFKNKKEDNSAAKEEYEKALKSYEKDSYQEALGILSWGFKKDSNYKPLYKLSANCLEKLGATEEAQLFINTIENFNKFESFNHLGTHFLKKTYFMWIKIKKNSITYQYPTVNR